MSKKIRIAIIGDSTVEWIRPYRNHKSDFTYSELLIKNNDDFIVDIFIRPGMTSHDALILVWQELMGRLYDHYIFSFGINDCTPRSYPRFFADYNNNILIPNNLFQKTFYLFYRVFTSTKVQTICSKIGISKAWINLNTFEKNINEIIKILSKETDAKILFITIPRTSQRVENILYNINSLIPKYSDIIKKQVSTDINIIDTNSLFEEDYEFYIPEGIHYSSDGHRLVYQEILTKLDTNV